MRSHLLAGLAAVALCGCSQTGLSGPHVVSFKSLPTYQGNADSLYLLTPNAYQASTRNIIGADVTRLTNRTREAGRFHWDLRAFDTGRAAPISLVEGWVVTQDKPVNGAGPAILRVSQASSGKSDELKIYATDYKNSAMMNVLVSSENSSRARVWTAYVLNSRYFGFQLSDKRLVFFDRTTGKFLPDAVDIDMDAVVLVDDAGQPYMREADRMLSLGDVRKVELPNGGVAAPLSPTEVFSLADRDDVPEVRHRPNPENPGKVAAGRLNAYAAHPTTLSPRDTCLLRRDYLVMRRFREQAMLDSKAQKLAENKGWAQVPLAEDPEKVPCDLPVLSKAPAKP
jgi:hypothetical protein